MKLSLTEENHSIISVYPNSSPYLTHWVRSPIFINQRKSMKLYWFAQAYFLIQWCFRPPNYDLKWSMICYIFLKEKDGKAIQWIRVNWNTCNHITALAKSNTSLLQLALHLVSLFFFLFLLKLCNDDNEVLLEDQACRKHMSWAGTQHILIQKPQLQNLRKVELRLLNFFPLCIFLSIQIQNYKNF